ncbi:MAG: hypothetical protein KAT25_05545 [Sulfuriflexus sp.]|nr:hypothetical protein [Sulfuriflexus sp.]
MNRTHHTHHEVRILDREQQFREMDVDLYDRVPIEGIHQSIILTDSFGNEWDDTGDFGEIDFRTVDE